MLYSVSYHLRTLKGASRCDKNIKTKVGIDNLIKDIIVPNFDNTNKNYREALGIIRVGIKYRDEIRHSGIIVSYDSTSNIMVLEADLKNSITSVKCALYLFVVHYYKSMMLVAVIFIIGNSYILKLYKSIQMKRRAEGFYREIVSVLQDNVKLRVKELQKMIVTKKLAGYNNIDQTW